MEKISLEEQIGKALLEHDMMMGTAESCTGGYIAHLITSIAGSSAYFAGGIVSYSNDVKQSLLGVPETDILNYGAVSQPVVEKMVQGAINALGCDCAVATSGIAGPTGGSPDKPVGTVWIAAATRDILISECFHFKGDRKQNIQQAAEYALRLLLDIL